MGTRVIALLALAGTYVLGALLLRRRVNALMRRRAFADEFTTRFIEYVNSGATDEATYAWLLSRSHKMQNDMGSFGVMRHFRPPYANYAFNQYPVILNAIPEVRQNFQDGMLARIGGQYADMVRDALLRYGGALDDEIGDAQKNAKNPFVAFRQGVQAIVTVPAYLLHWFGLLREPSIYSRRAAVKIVAGFVSVLTFLSAVITIAIGWEEFGAIFRSWRVLLR